MAGKEASIDSNFSFDDLENHTIEESSELNNQENENIQDSFEKAEETTDNKQIDYTDTESAYSLLETEDFIFTDKGLIQKSSISKDNSAKPANPNEDEKILGKFKSVDDLIKSYTELEKKLGSNSEAVNKLREIEPVLPMLEAMINDDNFLEMAERYFTNPEEQRKQLIKSLGLEDGYVFDLDNALLNPDSKDAKILEKLTAKKGKSNSNGIPPKNQNSNNQIPEEQKQAFIKKHGIKDEEFDLMLEQAKSYKITLDDIYFLINKDKIIEKAKKEAASSYREQSNVAQKIGRPKTNGSTFSKAPEDAFMDFIKLNAEQGIFS